MNKSCHYICLAISIAITVCLIGMTVITNAQVFTRYLFSWTPAWSEEIVRYAMVWIVMLGGAVLLYFDDHIMLYAVPSRLRGRARVFHRNLLRLVMLACSVMLAWTGFRFAFGMVDVLAPGSQLSMFAPTAAIPVGATIASVFLLLLIARDIRLISAGEHAELHDQFLYMDSTFKEQEFAEEGE